MLKSMGRKESDTTERLNNNLVLIVVQRSDSATYMYIIFHILFHCGLLQDLG